MDEFKFSEKRIAAYLNFPANNEIVYFQDFRGFKGVPSDANFYPTEIVNENICFVADGYGILANNQWGLYGKYGNGAIFIQKKSLPADIVEWCANNLLQKIS